jgi:phenylalanyl-tRNA synthetase alpha chain
MHVAHLINSPRSLSNEEVNEIQDQVVLRLKEQFEVEVR